MTARREDAFDLRSKDEPLSSDDFEIPPSIVCAICGLSSCDGCSIHNEEALDTSCQLPWESPQLGVLTRFFETAHLSATQPEQVFGTMAAGSIRLPLSFGLLAESLAVGSFSALWLTAFYWFFPQFTQNLLSTPLALTLAFIILSGLIVCVVAIHLLWGVFLEWGVGRVGVKASYNQGMRFGLYACGWDLLASPAGVLLSGIYLGPRQIKKLISSSIQVPRRALHFYLSLARSLNEQDERHALRAGLWLFGAWGVTFSLALFVLLLGLWLPGVFWQ